METSQRLATIIFGHSMRMGMGKEAGLPAIPQTIVCFALRIALSGELPQLVMVLGTTSEAMLRATATIGLQMNPECLTGY
jgi:hypothetical protein